MNAIELTLEEYKAVLKARKEISHNNQLNELFGFKSKKDSNFNNAKNNAVENINNTRNDIDDEKRKREELRNKLMELKSKQQKIA